jgi:hypothetical protein
MNVLSVPRCNGRILSEWRKLLFFSSHELSIQQEMRDVICVGQRTLAAWLHMACALRAACLMVLSWTLWS